MQTHGTRLFVGRGRLEDDGVQRRWRTETIDAAQGAELIAQGRIDDPADYEADPGLVDAVNVALLLGRPLLLTGRPGTGKSQLADRVAWEFDLAPVLGRTAHGYDPNAAFFTALRQDPVLARAHLIAEPWDAAYDGYQVGRFPGRFLEWNDKYRDAVRRYWLQRGVRRGEFARRFTASSDLFHHGQRRPSASVNFIAVHDGFTLADLTSYSRKHNEANGEGNRDGRDGEPCANLGVEGPSDDPAIVQRPRRVRRALLATLLLSQGTPMLCAGDEIAHSQQGNNNAYNQDNETTWLDWDQADRDLLAFVARCTALRREERALRHDRWFHPGGFASGEGRIAWLAPAGQPMLDGAWHDPSDHAFACLISPGASEPGARRVLLLFNPEEQARPFVLPNHPWELALDSSDSLPTGAVDSGRPLHVPPCSLVLLRDLAQP